MLNIAKLELRSLFVSPVAWVMLLIFIVQTSLAFLSRLENLVQWSFEGGSFIATWTLFAGHASVFHETYRNLAFYMPLLTMALVSREKQSGSIKLLMSSPVSVSRIVLGKYLAVVVYLLLYVAFICLLISIGRTAVPDLDLGYALSGLLGMFMLAIAYGAIGLFMSSLTTYQVVAAISSMAVFFALTYIGVLGQRVPFLADLAFWLSMSDRAEYMRDGLIASSDLSYFGLISALFVCLTILFLSQGRLVGGRVGIVSRYAAVIGIALFLGAVTSSHSLTYYWDTTRNKKETLSNGSVQAITSLEGNLKVSVLINVLDANAYRFLPEHRKRMERSLFEIFERRLGEIKFDYVMYYAKPGNERIFEANPGLSMAEIAQEFAQQNRFNFDQILPPSEIQRVFDVESEGNRNLFVLSDGRNAQVLRTFDDLRFLPNEAEISAALKLLNHDPVVVGYVSGHGERTIRDEGGWDDHGAFVTDMTNRYALVNSGFVFEEIKLDRPVESRFSVLVLADPVTQLSQASVDHLIDFYQEDGTILILGELERRNTVNAILNELGLYVSGELVVQTGTNQDNDVVFANTTPAFEHGCFKRWSAFDDETYVYFPSAAEIKILDEENPKYEALVLANTDVLLESAASAGHHFTIGVTTKSSASDENGRLAVIGDADFMSEQTIALSLPQGSENAVFVLKLFCYLADGSFPVDVSRSLPLDKEVTVDLRGVDRLRALLLGVLPFIVVMSGLWIIVSRRRQ